MLLCGWDKWLKRFGPFAMSGNVVLNLPLFLGRAPPF